MAVFLVPAPFLSRRPPSQLPLSLPGPSRKVKGSPGILKTRFALHGVKLFR